MYVEKAVLILTMIVVSIFSTESLCFSAEKITLTWWISKQASKFLTDLRAWGIEEFEKTHPNVKVNYTPMPFMDLMRK